ncbi:MAG TPA: YetF domain-containing protein [Xanthomonadaceae bacterium]|nr:YetF domain-containing protein [Xanthomonadaceae bacterium]
MSDLFDLAMPWWEFVLRAVVVYVVILVMVRISGKRSVGQYTPFDLILVVLLGTAVQNSLIGEDVSLLGGLLLAATLIALNWLVGLATSRSRRMDRLVEGVPVVLARNGRIYQEALRRENIAKSDFDEAMRQADCAKHEDIRLALLETDGKISIVTRQRDEA